MHVAEAFHGLEADDAVVVLERCFSSRPGDDVDVLEDVGGGLRAGLVKGRSAGDVGDCFSGQAGRLVTASTEIPAGDALAVHPSDHRIHLAAGLGCVFGLVGMIGVVPHLEVRSLPTEFHLVDPLVAEPLK